ncbi:DUF333 domain-containing protein [Candidatus Micrarchaeota archaeon]|nr:DUF333 domain-containing protein [Candidatus Micrarchaeota archaeon]
MRTLVYTLLVLGFLLAGCSTQLAQPTPEPTSPAATASATAETNTNANAANPAATHCVQLGYRNEIVDTPQGQSGTCRFPDNSTCDDWKFFRGECGQAFSACTKKGGKLGAVLMGPNGPVTSNSTCQFNDGTICEENELADGTCQPGQQVA